MIRMKASVSSGGVRTQWNSIFKVLKQNQISSYKSIFIKCFLKNKDISWYTETEIICCWQTHTIRNASESFFLVVRKNVKSIRKEQATLGKYVGKYFLNVFFSFLKLI